MPSNVPRRERVRRTLLSVAGLALFAAASAALTSVPLPPPEAHDRPAGRALLPPIVGESDEVVGSLELPPVAAALLSAGETVSLQTEQEEIENLVETVDTTEAGRPATNSPGPAETTRRDEGNTEETHEAAPADTQPPDTEPTASTAPPTTTTTTTVPTIDVGGAERSFVRRINSLRESEGLSPLSWDGSAGAVARSWSEHMVATGTFDHNPNLASQVSGNWSKVAENLARDAGSVGSAHGALAGSSSHYANMVDPDFTHVGVGVAVDADGEIWVTEVFVSR